MRYPGPCLSGNAGRNLKEGLGVSSISEGGGDGDGEYERMLSVGVEGGIRLSGGSSSSDLTSGGAWSGEGSRSHSLVGPVRGGGANDVI